jgi:hypothetical protein
MTDTRGGSNTNAPAWDLRHRPASSTIGDGIQRTLQPRAIDQGAHRRVSRHRGVRAGDQFSVDGARTAAGTATKLTPEARWFASLSGPSTVGAALRGRRQRPEVRAARGVADGRGHRHHGAPRLVRAAPGRKSWPGRSITPARAPTAPSSRSTARCCQRRWQSPGSSVTSAAPSRAPTAGSPGASSWRRAGRSSSTRSASSRRPCRPSSFASCRNGGTRGPAGRRRSKPTSASLLLPTATSSVRSPTARPPREPPPTLWLRDLPAGLEPDRVADPPGPTSREGPLAPSTEKWALCCLRTCPICQR